MSEPRRAVWIDDAWVEAGDDQIEVAGRVIRGPWLAGQSALDLAAEGIVVAEIVPADPAPQGVRAQARLVDIDGVPTEVLETQPYSPAEIETMRNSAIVRTKAEAERRIEVRWPLWRQINALRAGQSMDWIDAVRAASNSIEARLPQDAAGLLAFDPAASAEWPE